MLPFPIKSSWASLTPSYKNILTRESPHPNSWQVFSVSLLLNLKPRYCCKSKSRPTIPKTEPKVNSNLKQLPVMWHLAQHLRCHLGDVPPIKCLGSRLSLDFNSCFVSMHTTEGSRQRPKYWVLATRLEDPDRVQASGTERILLSGPAVAIADIWEANKWMEDLFLCCKYNEKKIFF